MQALLLVVLVTTVTARWEDPRSDQWSPLNTKCQEFKKKGLCLFDDQLTYFASSRAKFLAHKCCKSTDVVEKAYIVTKNGDKIVKKFNGYFLPKEFDTCAIKGETFCPKCCEVNGNWGHWTEYSSCSVTCGSGVRTRTRQCNDPAPSNGGSDCVGMETDTQTCNTLLCSAELCASFDGYVYDSATNICIKVFQNQLNFFGAKFQCEEDDGVLFKMDSLAKRDFLASQLQGDKTFSFFLGAIDKNGQNEFIHLDGTVVDWIGEDPLPGNQDCVRFNRPRSEMDEAFCYSLYKSVCEKDVTVTPIEP